MKDFSIKKIILLLAVAMLFLLIVLNFEAALDAISYVIGLLMPLIVGLCMAFILNVLMKFIENKLFHRLTLKIRRPISLILSLIVVAGILVFVLVMIIPTLRDTISSLISHAPAYAKAVQEWGAELLKTLGLTEEVKNFFGKDLDQTIDKFIDFINGTGSVIAKNAAGVAAGVFSAVANAVLGFVFALYVLLTKERLGRQVNMLLGAYLPEKRTNYILKVARLTRRLFEHFVAGQCIEAVCIGVLTALGSLIIHPAYAVMLGVLIGITALIPVLGAWIGTIVGALLLLTVSPVKSLVFIIFILLLQQLDNHIIYPKIIGKSIGLPGMWVLLAVIVGGSVGGIFGIIVGVPLFSVIYSLLKESSEDRLAAKAAKKAQTASASTEVAKCTVATEADKATESITTTESITITESNAPTEPTKT
ncbi:MAG: AI-2E family transporter [Clostridiales Family XIII bacterium]|jgi:predicted PurR-regulated permease PerM|nr:AI-2E family transporter [Clostridiales Family XIII bacterium]